MATVPGILHISNYQGAGPQPLLAVGDPTFDLKPFNDPSLLNFVPGGGAESADFFPFYDHTASTVHYVMASSTTTTIVATPSPGWTVNDPAIVGRTVTVLAPYLGVPGLALVPLVVRIIISNTADTLTVSSWGLTIPGGLGVQFRIGTGRFDVYHPAPATVGFGGGVGTITRTLGGNPASGGQGAGPDIGYMTKYLTDVYPQPPYFMVTKVISTSGLNGGWKTGGVSRASFEAEMPRIVAAAAERGHTIAWRMALVDLFQEDMREAGLSILFLPLNLLDIHTWLKTFLGNPALELQLVSPHPRFLLGTKPGAAVTVRSMVDTYANAVPRVRVIDMGRAQFGYPIQMAGDPAPDDQFYTTLDYVKTLGHESAALLKRANEGIAEPIPTNACPMIYAIGDSIMAGGVQLSWILDSVSLDRTGPVPPGTLRKPTQLCYNRQAQEIQIADPATNGNRSGDVNLSSGPELSMHDALEPIYPLNYCMVKRGASSSALSSLAPTYQIDGPQQRGGRWERQADQHWREFTTDVLAARALIWERGLVPDDRLLVVNLGTNDASQVGDGAKFVAALPGMVADFRQLLRTRSSGPELLISWCLPYKGSYGRLASEMDIIRAGLLAYAAKDSRFVTHHTDDLERSRVDGLHESPETTVQHGFRAIEACAGKLLV